MGHSHTRGRNRHKGEKARGSMSEREGGDGAL